MQEIDRKHFYESVQTAPLAAQGFFESVITHFDRDNMVDVHCTDTHGGDLRLAIPGELLNRRIKRNFATMYWQSRKQVIFARTYLTPAELTLFGFDGATRPKSSTEPLKSDIRLSEEIWRYSALGFIRALKAAQMQMAH